MSICIHYRKPTDQGEPMRGDIPFDDYPSASGVDEVDVDLGTVEDGTEYVLTYGPYELALYRIKSGWIEFSLYREGDVQGSYFTLPVQIVQKMFDTVDLGRLQAKSEEYGDEETGA